MLRNGKATTIPKELIDIIYSSNSKETLRSICCDGTNVNIGRHGGILHIMELNLERPIQWIICMLHFNELPFRHIFRHIFNNILVSYFLFTLSSDHLYCSATLTEFEYTLINTLYHHLPGF